MPGIPTISLLHSSIDLQKTEMFMEVPLVIRLVNYPQKGKVSECGRYTILDDTNISTALATK